jgi:hypothetical protein
MSTHLSIYPGTLWEPDDTVENIKGFESIKCKNCGRDASCHGASEAVTKRLGFALNQRHRVCLPAGTKNADEIWVPKSLEFSLLSKE